MKPFLAVILSCALSLVGVAGDNAYRVTYDGGSLADAKTGASLKVYIEGNQVRFMKDKAQLAVIPASAITEVSYGQDVHRRVGDAMRQERISRNLGWLRGS